MKQIQPSESIRTVDGRNPAAPGMHKTLQIRGQTTNLNWLAGFLPSTISPTLPKTNMASKNGGFQ